MQRIGLIGVGFIGILFADALLDAGHPLTVYDVDASKTAHATDRGQTRARIRPPSTRPLTSSVLALPGRREVTSVMEEDGLLAALDAG